MTLQARSLSDQILTLDSPHYSFVTTFPQDVRRCPDFR